MALAIRGSFKTRDQGGGGGVAGEEEDGFFKMTQNATVGD